MKLYVGSIISYTSVITQDTSPPGTSRIDVYARVLAGAGDTQDIASTSIANKNFIVPFPIGFNS